jgi:shikimate dehydrogenase
MTSEVWLLGDPVSRSLSPAMQKAAFEALGIDGRYVVREISLAELEGTIVAMRAGDHVIGANVTIPHKQSVIPLLDRLDSLAGRIGAVNTISRRGPALVGSNTDVEGFRRALGECGYDVQGKTVAIIGAGGAARAVAAAVQPLATRIVVIARHPEQARRLCGDLQLKNGEPTGINRLQERIAGAAVVVNATPSDLPPHDWLRGDQRLFDIRSRRSAEGRAMLLHQGAASFEIWTGRKAPLEAMRGALDAAAAAVAV